MTWGEPRIQAVPDVLHVLTVCFNPMRFHRRYDLHARFHDHLASFEQARPWTVEVAIGEREFEVTAAGNPSHLQLRTRSSVWLKENALNLLVERLPLGWQYVAFVDADVTFLDPHWVDNTLHALQHYDVVQPWSHATDLGPNGEPLLTFKGFGYGYVEGIDPGPIQRGSGFTAKWHPGFAWAFRREAIDAVGGLIDYSILGSADHLMAHALIGRLTDALPGNLSEGYKAACLRWEQDAKALRQNVGYVPGTILHHWHGSKANRQYANRWKILADCGFDPVVDLRRDWQGLWQLTDRSIPLRDALRRYFSARNEDSVEPPSSTAPSTTAGKSAS